MSYKDGISALNLEMPDRVPRTEYSAASHWDLVKKVTGIDVSVTSDEETKTKAQQQFFKAWNFDFCWNVNFNRSVFDNKRTDMGHAVYAAGGVDFSQTTGCPFNDTDEVLSLDFDATYGVPDKKKLVEFLNKSYRDTCILRPDMVNMTGIYVTCMSGLIEILGWEMLLMTCGVDHDGFGDLANRYAKYMMPYFEALAECDSPVIMIHDDIVWTEGAFISPEWYRKYLFPNYKKMFAPIIEKQKKIMYTSDGNYTEFIDDIAGCNINGFVLEPTTDMNYIAEKYGKTHAFIGNADTRILLSGTKEDIYNEVKRCMDIGKNCPGFFMAVGNHIPANTPVDNALYYNECYEKLSKR